MNPGKVLNSFESNVLQMHPSPRAGQFTTVFLLGTGLVALLSQKNVANRPALGLYSMSMAFSNYNDEFLSTGEAEDDGGLTPTKDDNEAWR